MTGIHSKKRRHLKCSFHGGNRGARFLVEKGNMRDKPITPQHCHVDLTTSSILD